MAKKIGRVFPGGSSCWFLPAALQISFCSDSMLATLKKQALALGEARLSLGYLCQEDFRLHEVCLQGMAQSRELSQPTDKPQQKLALLLLKRTALLITWSGAFIVFVY